MKHTYFFLGNYLGNWIHWNLVTSLVKLISSTLKLWTFINRIVCLAKLANSCQKNDKHAYAALCWQAVAKCEESMGHNCEQALAHQKAALQFFSECKKTESSGLISPYNENLQVCYYIFMLWLYTRPIGPLLCLERKNFYQFSDIE